MFDRPCDPRSLLRQLAEPHRSTPPRPEAARPGAVARALLARPRIPEPALQRRFVPPEVDLPDRGAFFWLPLSWAESSTSIPAGPDGPGRETPRENGRQPERDAPHAKSSPEPSGIDRQQRQTDLVSGGVRVSGTRSLWPWWPDRAPKSLRPFARTSSTCWGPSRQWSLTNTPAFRCVQPHRTPAVSPLRSLPPRRSSPTTGTIRAYAEKSEGLVRQKVGHAHVGHPHIHLNAVP